MHTLGDHIRRLAYGLAFTATIGSLWTFAWAKHADEQMYDYQPAAVQPALVQPSPAEPPAPAAVSR